MGLFKNKGAKQIESLCKNILIGGEAGEGIKSAGKIIALSLIKSGYNVFVYDEYPSLIRGGHNMVSTTYSTYPIYSAQLKIDILICLNRETFDKHKENLNPGAIVIHDHIEFEITPQDLESQSFEAIEIPVNSILKRYNLPKITQNISYLSGGLCVAGIKKEVIEEVITDELKNKKNLLESNLRALEEGYSNVEEYFNLKGGLETPTRPSKKTKRYLLSGNEAVCFGAVKAGMGFYGAYPMTPASSMLDFLSAHQRDFDIVVKQTEDEIAAINMAIGASFAGARAMVGTSGGGFSLMVEGLGLAAITETPIVIVLAQRPGPATGLPSWTAQGDLLYAIHASQDEFPRIVLTTTDVEECFYMSFEAFNLAEKYQVPVIVLIDKCLSECLSILEIDKSRNYKIDRGLLLNDRMLARIDNYNRYELTESGVSPRSIPGQANGVFLANSDEGDGKGITSEEANNRTNKVIKRFKKVELIKADLPQLNFYGDPKAKTSFITWGSPKGAVLEAMRTLQTMGQTSKLLALNYVEPFPSEEVEKFINSSDTVVLVENNFTSQLGKLITMNTGFDIQNKILKFDGRPIFPSEILEFVLNKKF